MSRMPVTLISIQAAKIMEEMLLRGFTTVRDAGGADWGLAQAVERGFVRGPRLFYAGRTLSQTGGHGDFRPRDDSVELCACQIYTSGFSHVADGVPAVRKAAREELRRGASQIKIMASGGVASPTDPVWNVQYSREEMSAIVEEAAGWRTYAMAHAYTPEAVTRAVDAGVRTIEHGNLIDDATAARMAEAGAYLVPTLVTYFALDELGRDLGFPEISQRKIKDVLDAGLSSVEKAKRAGVVMGFGTDLLGETHEQQNREFAIRSEVLTAAEIIHSATRANAEILQREDELGVIAPGAFADILLVDGNPLEDISLLARPHETLSLIMARGLIVTDRSV
jgi:imidazolonepropionase-like amidohydrolase